ncbi:MAG: hypothetical protein LAO20_06990 [Acidobacteriia bacterium]|nr:hypothetical protein [Terriglobia bacterium]
MSTPHHLPSGAHFTIAVLLLSSAYSYCLPNLDMKKQTVLAERAGKAGVRILLAVDTDDIVHEIDIGLPGSGGTPVITANLGTRVTASGNLRISDMLPRANVVTLARRVTLDNGMTIHVMIAWAFSEFPEVLLPYCYLYVFRENQHQVTQIAARRLGTELDQFIVEDVNRDGNLEILVATSENAVSSMNIWQIQTDGDVKQIQRLDGYHVYTLADRFMDQDVGVIVTHKSEHSTAGAACFNNDEYMWSPKLQRFVKQFKEKK